MTDHLTDNQIQQFLDGSLKSDNSIVTHLDSCSQCQHALADYKILYAGLKEEIDFSLSADFADTVLEKIETPDSSPVPFFTVGHGVVGFAAISALIAAALYFLDLLAIGSATRLWSIKTFASASAIVNIVKQFLSTYGISPLMVLFVIVTITAVVVIDKVVINMKKNRGPVTYSLL